MAIAAGAILGSGLRWGQAVARGHVALAGRSFGSPNVDGPRSGVLSGAAPIPRRGDMVPLLVLLALTVSQPSKCGGSHAVESSRHNTHEGAPRMLLAALRWCSRGGYLLQSL